MQYKMLAFDLDGTTLSDDYKMSISFEKWIKKQKENHYICMATGRSVSDAYRYYNQLELNTIMICYNGAYVYNPRTNDILFSKPLILAPNCNIGKVFMNEKIKDLIENVIISSGQSTYYLNTKNNYLFQMLVDRQLPNVRLTIDSLNGKEIHRIVIALTEKGKNEIDTLLSYLQSDIIQDRVKVYPWKFHNEIIDISVGNVDKWDAIKRVCEYECIPDNSIVAIGDGTNDIKMLEKSSIGICMKNAPQEVKEKAKYITEEDNNHDGAFIALTKILSEEELCESMR